MAPDKVKQILWLPNCTGARHRVPAETVTRFNAVEEVKASDIPQRVYHLYIPTGMKTRVSDFPFDTTEYEYIYAGDVCE